MQTFTGWQYMLINLANAFGLDKLLFPERIEWALANMHQLEQLAGQADSKPLYMSGVLAIRKVLRGEPTGHLVGMDACCSGIQIMSALTGCIKGAMATGLVDPNRRADAYSQLTGDMCVLLGTTSGVSRGDAKDALMTMFYGSKAKPIEIFGEDTPELNTFYEAGQAMAPGAWDLLQTLLASWQSGALKHEWKLPDGYDAMVKVMETVEARIEVDELNHASFTYEFKVNQGTKRGKSNVANVVHSVDAYVLRTIHRRCNYDRHRVEHALDTIQGELLTPRLGNKPTVAPLGDKIMYYIAQYERSTMADIVILSHINRITVKMLSTKHLEQLRDIMNSMMAHQPFEVVTIHDEFKCSPNHMNHLRQHYINIFAELAESELLSDLLSQIHKAPGVFPKLSNNLGQLIRQSNYALS